MRRAALALAALLLLAPGALAGQKQKKPDEPCTPKEGKAVVEGVVLDSLTAVPLDGAGVSVRWQPDPRNDYRQEKEAEADAAGRFRVCDVQPGVPLLVLAGFWGQRSVERRLDGVPAAPLTLLVDAPHSLVSGRVVDAGSGAPVVGASVRLEGVADAQVTAADGAFRFGPLPPRDYPLTVEHLAFATLRDTLEVDVASGVDATIRLAPGVIALDPITVVVRSLVLERNGFYERQQRSSGHFVTRQQIEAQRALQSSEILRRVPSVRIQRGRDGNLALARGSCPFRYVIDGTRIGPEFSIDLIPAEDIEGLEVYLGPAQVPGEFTGLSSDASGTCGVIIVWTRRHLKI